LFVLSEKIQDIEVFLWGRSRGLSGGFILEVEGSDVLVERAENGVVWTCPEP
jgi:hypothetical protein